MGKARRGLEHRSDGGAWACVLGAGGGRQPKATARGGPVAEAAVAADEKRWLGVGFKDEGERARGGSTATAEVSRPVWSSKGGGQGSQAGRSG